MAKGNLFLGTARRKVGDVVFYRRNGQQVSRVRVRNIANPRTEGQATQRVFFGEVAKFYSPLAVTLEQSWEGRNRSESADAFRAAALRDVRAQGIYVQKNLGFVPLPVMVSYGSLPPVSYGFVGNNAVVPMNAPLETENTIGFLSRLFVGMGTAVEGDQVTFIVAGRDESDTNLFVPYVGRFIVASDSTLELQDVMPSVYFEYDNGRLMVFPAENSGMTAAGFAVIVSRYSNGVWRRSSQRMVLEPDFLEALQSEDQRRIAIASYMDGTGTVTSDVYLNGGEYATGSEIAESITLADGRPFSPTSINYDNGIALVTGSVNSSTIASAYVTLGNDYLLSATSKGALPEGAPAISGRLDGNNDLVRTWLQTNGVAASVWAATPEPGE